MDHFYKIVTNFFEELRCDSAEREYVIAPKDIEETEKKLAKKIKSIRNISKNYHLAIKHFWMII